MKKCTFEEKLTLMNTALGEEKADLVLRGAKLVDVHTLEIYPADVAIKGEHIAYVGDVSHTIGPQTQIMDVHGRFLAPGLIDGHLHIGGTHMSMTEFGKASLLHGGTALATGFYEITVILSAEGTRFCLEELKRTGVKPLFVIPLPAFHQNETFENTKTFTEEIAMQVLEWPDCYGVNEVNLARVAGKNESILRIVDRAQQLGKVLVGHASGVRGKLLQAGLCFTSTVSDHETVAADEANEKARLGVMLAFRDGSVGEELTAILPELHGQFARVGDFGYATDEIDPARMVFTGYLDEKVRRAIRSGVPAPLAIRAGSLNAARFFHVEDQIGSIAPGKRADILILNDLDHMEICDVLTDGMFAVRGGKYCRELQAPPYPPAIRQSVHLEPLRREDLRIAAPKDCGASVAVRVIGANGDPLITDALVERLPVRNGEIGCEPERDIIKLVTVDRHERSGRIGRALLKGSGIRCGALATSYGVAGMDLTVMGSSDEDMLVAANYVIEHQGALVVVKDGAVIAALDLPIGGILSDLPYAEIAQKMAGLQSYAEQTGCVMENVFHKIAFLIYPTQFPSLKLSTYGLADISVGGEHLIDMFPDFPSEN